MDCVLRNGVIADGTGGPATVGDVLVEGDRITAVAGPGELSVGPGVEEVDLTGLVLAPGFIDVHTHLDAQVLWDADLYPSSWHGVTSVLMGNCGVGFAPTHAQDRDLMMRIMVNVEGMSLDTMRAGIPWTFESYPEYLAALDATPKRINVSGLIGHTPVRLWVMGEDALSREATESEIAEMARLVTEAVRAGARGFSTLRTAHSFFEGRPTPSRVATHDEIFQLGSAVAAAGKSDVIIEVALGPEFHLEEAAALSQRSGVKVTWIAAATGSDCKWNRDSAPPGTALGMVERSVELGIWPQIAPRPISTQLHALQPAPMVSFVEAFKDVLAVPVDERLGVHRDPAWRARAKAQAREKGPKVWPKIILEETGCHLDLIGRNLADLARERGADPLDLYVDLVVEDGLATRFRWIKTNDDMDEVAQLVSHEQAVLGLGDAGAHMNQICEAANSTALVHLWVNERPVLTMEQAVRKLTGQPADLFGLRDRGYIRPGHAADLVAFDLATIGYESLERVMDLPAGGDRLIVRSRGIQHVWVNGSPIRTDGKDLDLDREQYPGRLLRS